MRRILALLLAGKLPVLLNWTTGPVNLAHAAKLMKLTHVVTSKAFVDRLGVTVEGAEYLYLEDLRSSMGKSAVLKSGSHAGGPSTLAPQRK